MDWGMAKVVYWLNALDGDTKNGFLTITTLKLLVASL